MKYQEIKALISKKEAQLKLAEMNYKETRSDCFLIEQHNLKSELNSLKIELDSTLPTKHSEDDQSESDVLDFVAPSDVEQLPSYISKHIIRVYGNSAIDFPLDKLSCIQSELLGIARAYYEDQNDADAVSRVDEMLSKIQSRLIGDPKDGEGTVGNDGGVDETIETPSNDTNDPKHTDVPEIQTKSNRTPKKGTGSKNKGKK